MEGSGENWPSDSDLEVGDSVNDFCFDDEEFVVDDESHSFGDTVDPMMGETDKKGRQRELTERLLALSATIPGLKKKMDNTSILDKASKYVKQLQQRVRELEQEAESHSSCSNKGTTSSCDYEPNHINLPEVRARVLHKEVLVIIHCEKQKGVLLRILSQLEKLHLSVVNSSVLPFGKSTLDITIIAQSKTTASMRSSPSRTPSLRHRTTMIAEDEGCATKSPFSENRTKREKDLIFQFGDFD